MILYFDLLPRIRTTFDFGRFNCSATASMIARFAFPSVAGSRTRTTQLESSIISMPGFLFPGFTVIESFNFIFQKWQLIQYDRFGETYPLAALI